MVAEPEGGPGPRNDASAMVDTVDLVLERPSRVRIVHLGLGAFARAHLCDYTQAVNETLDENEQWGIAAFTGRSPRMADVLSAQDNLYTLTVQDVSGVSTKVMTALIASHPGDDLDALKAYLRDPDVSIVTLTLTEGGYGNGLASLADPTPASDPATATATESPTVTETVTATVPTSNATVTAADIAAYPVGRLALALFERFLTDAGPISLISLDNMSNNGDTLGNLLRQAHQVVAPDRADEYAQWFQDNVGLVSTVVDRITPRMSTQPGTPELPSGAPDIAPVVTEGFREWELTDTFTGPRPEWELAGAHLVENLEPFTRRKLLLLNAAHSALAYAGIPRGFATVREAIADPDLARLVTRLWRDAAKVIPPEAGDLEEYTNRLVARFANPHLDHELAQIAEGGTDKMRIRIGPVLFDARRDGWRVPAHEQAVAAWADFAQLETMDALKLVLSLDAADTAEPYAGLVEAINEFRSTSHPSTPAPLPTPSSPPLPTPSPPPMSPPPSPLSPGES